MPHHGEAQIRVPEHISLGFRLARLHQKPQEFEKTGFQPFAEGKSAVAGKIIQKRDQPDEKIVAVSNRLG